MRNVLAAVEPSKVLRSVLETAVLVAQRFNSHVEGLYLLYSADALLGARGMAAGGRLAVNFKRESKERARQTRNAFESFMRDKGIPLNGGSTTPEACSAAWNEVEANGDAVIGSRGRLFDVTVVGRPVEKETTPSLSILETALFDSGRPVLLAPPQPPPALGETVVIAWNGSTESARSVALAIPFLAQATIVHVLAVEGGSVPGPNAGEVAEMLVRHGIPAQATGVRPQDQSIGEAILAETASLGADLLVKGAYTNSRVRQMIFGGATRHIISHADLPVLMAH